MISGINFEISEEEAPIKKKKVKITIKIWIND
jgi:hypothetical protein